MEQFKHLTGVSHGVRRDGAAALDLCYVACGRLDGFWEKNLGAWDIGAGSLIVEEAGGRVSDLNNSSLDLTKGNILATNYLIHDEVIAALQKIKIAA
jgi:myo-inositol-1(or 4)-monophosphatase